MSFIGIVWNWKFFLIFEALRINWDCLSRLSDTLSTRPEHAPAWMNTRSGSRVLNALVFFCIAAQIVTVIFQFFWFPWYNVIITALTASVAAAVFIPDRFHSSPEQLIHGVHQAFLLLGALTILSASIFLGLKGGDGAEVSQHKAAALPVE